MRDYEDIQKAKRRGDLDSVESAVEGLTPGYLAGFDLAFDPNGVITVKPGIANVGGRMVSVSRDYRIPRENYFLDPVENGEGYIYLSVTGEIRIDNVAPEFDALHFYNAHPATKWRSLGKVSFDAGGNPWEVLSENPVNLSEINATRLVIRAGDSTNAYVQTVLDGDKLRTGLINVDELFAEDITFSGMFQSADKKVEFNPGAGLYTFRGILEVGTGSNQIRIDGSNGIVSPGFDSAPDGSVNIKAGNAVITGTLGLGTGGSVSLSGAGGNLTVNASVSEFEGAVVARTGFLENLSVRGTINVGTETESGTIQDLAGTWSLSSQGAALSGWRVTDTAIYSATDLVALDAPNERIIAGDITLDGSNNRIVFGSDTAGILIKGVIGSEEIEIGANADIRLSAPNKLIRVGTSEDMVGLSALDGIWAGSSVKAAAPFQVGLDGRIIAQYGTVGGFKLGANFLTSRAVDFSSNIVGGSGITLNHLLSRVSVFDSADQETVSMGYLEGLIPYYGSGTATGGSSTTLADTSQSWDPDMYAGLTIAIVGGTGAGQTRTISSMTADTITVSVAWDTIPDNTSVYEIYLDASTYGFWARRGDKLRIEGDGTFDSGDWILEHDANYLIKDSTGSTNLVRIGTFNGRKGLFVNEDDIDYDGTTGEPTPTGGAVEISPDRVFFGDESTYLWYDRGAGDLTLKLVRFLVSNLQTSVKGELHVSSQGDVNNLTAPLSLTADSTAATLSHSNQIQLSAGGTTATISSDKGITIQNDSPTLVLQDTNHNSGFIHVNNSNLYILRGGANADTWSQVNGAWPAYWDLKNNDMYAGGNIYGRSVNGAHDVLYRWGGIYLTWDSYSYGTNFFHSITSTRGGSWSDDITINSFGSVRVNIDTNVNDYNSTFEIGRHTTGTSNLLFQVNEYGSVGINTAARTDSYKLSMGGHIRMNNHAVNYADQFHCQNNGRGDLRITTRAGSLPGFPNDNYPTLKTSYGHLYISIGGKYTGWLSNVNSSGGVIIGGGGSNVIRLYDSTGIQTDPQSGYALTVGGSVKLDGPNGDLHCSDVSANFMVNAYRLRLTEGAGGEFSVDSIGRLFWRGNKIADG